MAKELMSRSYRTIEFTDSFFETLTSSDFNKKEQMQLLKALRLFSENESHPSLRVHQLKGDRKGSWAIRASRELRITFERNQDGRPRLLTCSRHYDR